MGLETNISFHAEKNQSQKSQSEAKIKSLKAEISRKASMANKRIKRLEQNKLTNTPAYRKYVKSGGHKFSVAGKDYNELQKELKRVDSFIDSKTSTVRGTHKVLKDIARNANIEWGNIKDLTNRVNTFFDVADKVEQYMKATNDAGAAIGYQKIWQAINEYTEKEHDILLESTDEVEDIIPTLVELTKEMAVDYVGDEVMDTFEMFNKL